MPTIVRDPIYDSDDPALEALSRNFAAEVGVDPDLFDEINVGFVLEDDDSNTPIIEVLEAWRAYLTIADERKQVFDILISRLGTIKTEFTGTTPNAVNGTLFTNQFIYTLVGSETMADVICDFQITMAIETAADQWVTLTNNTDEFIVDAVWTLNGADLELTADVRGLSSMAKNKPFCLTVNKL